MLSLRRFFGVAAIQALLQAYVDYYGAIADYSRAEFTLYRALGNPAQVLEALSDPFATPKNCLIPPQQPGSK